MSKIADQTATEHEKAAFDLLKGVTQSSSLMLKDGSDLLAAAQVHATLAVSHRLEALYRLQQAKQEDLD